MGVQESQTAEAIQAWLVSQLADLLYVEPDEIDIREVFDSYGLASRDAVMLSGDLEEWMGRRLSPTVVYEYPTIEALARYLAGEPDVEEAVPEVAISQEMQREPIAVIGVGCRFPGADSPAAFWQLLRDGVDAITEVPAERWDVDAYFDLNPKVPGKMYTRWGGFLANVDVFDAQFFGIAPREAINMDPQQRLLLEVTWEALEHAGQAAANLVGSQTGVFVGISNNDYGNLRRVGDFTQSINPYSGTGNVHSVAAGRLSYVLGLQGPCVALDTACSSSLVAVHLACQSLRNAECDMALAGGVNLILSPEGTIYFSRLRVMAADGRCKTFDAAADGYVRSEGCGVVVLKRLSDALADGDNILAVIRGSAINQDGRSQGLTAPNGLAQQAVIRKALADAGVTPDQISYVETHGTGTALGDPIEVQALAAVLGEGRAANEPFFMGAVKASIGHAEAAAGVAGLIKVVLALQHGEIPPHLHLREPNPLIAWQDIPVAIPAERMTWPYDERRRIAGISAFGFSGTNAHAIVEETPSSPHRSEESLPGQAYLLPLSARSPEALQAMAAAYQDFLAADAVEPAVHLADICYTAGVRRSHHDYRLAVVAHNREEFVEQLEAFRRDEARSGLSSGRYVPGLQHKVVFVFSGQGSQWFGMGRELLEQEPIFRETLERCDQAIQQYADWSLLEQLTADESESRLVDQIDVIQPTLFAIQVGLAALWRSWGIEPDAVVGHSMGEVAAACVASALTLDDAARIICRRSNLMRRVSGKGAMAVVGLSLEEAAKVLTGYEDRLSTAVSNGPRSTVLSGDPESLQEVLDTLTARDIFCRRVKVNVASHSPQMDPLCADLSQALEGLSPEASSIPIYSTVNNVVSDGRDLNTTYWVKNLRKPVRFWTTVEQLLEDGHDIFIEISPHPILLSTIRKGLCDLGQDGDTLPSMRRREGERAVMLGSCGALHGMGYPVDWRKLYPAGGWPVHLPAYPWQRERFWLSPAEIPVAGARRRRLISRGGDDAVGHPLLGMHLASAVNLGTHFWEADLGADLLPYLTDHRVQGAIVLPAAAYVEMALAAAGQAFGSASVTLEDLAFKQALILPEDGTQTVQMVVSSDRAGIASYQLFSRQTGDNPQVAAWTLHASGTIRIGETDTAPSAVEHARPQEIQARCQQVVSVSEHYEAMRASRLEYGPSFQGVEQIWRRDGEALGRVRLPEMIDAGIDAYRIHPALLDAGFQVLGAALPQAGGRVALGEPYVPVGVERFRITGRVASSNLWSHAIFRDGHEPDSDTVEGDVFLLDVDGQLVAEALGLRLQRLERARRADIGDWFYRILWEPQSHPQEDRTSEPLSSDRPGSWLIFDDRSGLGETLCSRLEVQGERCVMVSPGQAFKSLERGRYHLNPARLEDFSQLLVDALGDDQPSCRGIVHLWGLDDTPAEETTLATLEAAQALGCGSVLHLIQALAQAGWRDAPRLWVATRGAQAMEAGAEAPGISQSPLWGLGRTIFHEHPDLRCALVDLSPGGSPAAEVDALFQELWADGRENQIVLRGEVRYVARLVRYRPEGTPAEAPEQPEKRRFVPETDHNFRLEIPTPGVLDNLTLRTTARRAPGPGQVEIQVHAAGLNFLDVLSALGLRPDLPDGPILLGTECAGKIVALGEGVEGLQVGDKVVAVASAGFSAYTTTLAPFVAPKPAHLSWEEAATIPIVFLTTYYALNYLGRLGKGERVLIHSAAGGVGLAAVQLAQQSGAEIFATAGSPEKRDYLRQLGIEHVMDSRSLAFADEVMTCTNGEGVDVVLNSLSGEAIPRGLSILRSYGRFLEISKRDIYENTQIGLRPFHKNLSYFAIDLARMAAERPDFFGALLCEVMQQFEDGSLEPLPLTVFPISEAVEAYRYMAQAKHTGKIVLSLQEPEVWVEPSAEATASLRPDGTYLITGGLGGLGLTVARWMVERGAHHLVLVGRSGASPAAQEVVDALRAADAEVVIARADVTQEHQVARVLADVAQSMPPLRGIIHAAGTLDDGILLQLNVARFRSVMAPKIDGAWNLHKLTLDAPLDFFVLFSSTASLLGSPGQGNYSAANAFLDTLAHYRSGQGRPALSINWGPWADVGLAARPDRGNRLAFRGFDSIKPQQGVEALGRLLRQNAPQVGAMPLDMRQLRQFYPRVAEWSLLAHLAHVEVEDTGDEHKPEESSIRAALLAAESEPQRRSVLGSYLQQQVSQVLGMSATRFDEQTPLASLGLDSLMAVELKNRIETNLGVQLPIATLLQSPKIGELVEELLAQVTTPASEQLPRLTAAQEEPALSEAGVREYPLSQGQRAMWFQHQIAPGSVYNPVYAVRIRADVDVSRLRRAFQKLVDRHPALRTTFGSRGGAPFQRVHERMDAFLHHEDASGWSEAELYDRLVEEANRVFDLEHGPLLRVFFFTRSAGEHIMMLSAHHIVVDLWSLALITSEFSAIYADPRGEADLPELEVKYTDYVRWQQELLDSPVGERMWDYWRSQLEGELPDLNLPTDRPRPPVQTFRGSVQSTDLGTELTRKIRAVSERYGVTPFVTLLAAFQTLIHRYTGQEDVIVGSPTTGRSQLELAGLVGYFASPVALRTSFSGEPKFFELLTRVQQTVMGALANQDYPLVLLVEKLRPARDPSRPPIFQVMFVLQRSHLLYEEGLTQFALSREGVQMDLGGLPLESMVLEQRMSPFDLTMQVADSGAELGAAIEYNVDLFDAATIRRMMGHFKTLLEGIVAAPERPISHLPLLTESERYQLLVEWNDTRADYPQDVCVHHLFEAQVARTPNTVAVVFSQTGHLTTRPPDHLTYDELNRRANQLAHHLQKLGVGPDTLVGICVERSLDMVVGLLGILKAGGAYLPLDPTYPQERLSFMLEDADISILLTQVPLVDHLPESRTVICLDADWETVARESRENPISGVTPENLAYVIYTSGSTGRPKGVLLEHRGLCNLVEAQTQAFGVEAGSRVLQFASFGFDASVSETFMALLTGATLYLARQETLASVSDLHQLLSDKAITTVTLPPSVLTILSAEGLSVLQTVISAGEACSPEVVARWADGRRFFNAYGPTEATVGPTMYPVEGPLDGATNVPIGRPIANTQGYLLDAHLQPVPVGVPGELHIGGVGLARGYLNRPELTAQKFILNPFAPPASFDFAQDRRRGEQGGAGARLYKTGDLARYRPDGNIEFLGRIDHQVKVRGFRIELGEIGVVLRQHPAVQEAVVLAREDTPSAPSSSLRTDKQLVGYVVFTQEPAPTIGELRGFLKERLPEYMVPSVFVTLEALPLTPSGKVDRKSLPAPTGDRPNLGTTYVTPQTEVQRTVTAVWQEVLGVEKVGIYDNFFDLGGHSLLVVKAHGKLQEMFGQDLPMVEMFRYPTISALAERLTREPDDQPSVQKSRNRAEKQKEAMKRQRQLMKRISRERAGVG